MPPSRSGNGSGASRPAASENISGAELRAVFAKDRQARRSPASAAQASNQGTPAKPTPAKQADAASPAAPKPKAGSIESHATSSPEGEESVIDALTQPPATETTPDTTGAPPAVDAETAPSQTAAPAASEEPDLEAILDDPEGASEEAIKGIKDKAIRRLLGRIHKLTARLREGERQQASPNEAPREAAVGDPELTKLNQDIGVVRQAFEWARANRDGGIFTDSNGTVRGEYTADQVEQILANAPAHLADLSARKAVREEGVRQREQQTVKASLDAATKAYPWLGKQDSEEYTQAVAVLHQAPYLKQHPEWPIWLADAIEGRKARMAREAAPAPKLATPRPVPPRIPPPAAAAAPRIDPVAKALNEAEVAYEQSGSADDLKRVMALRRQVKRR